MCLLIVKPAGKPLPPDKILQNAWDNNYDGFGLAFDGGNSSLVTIRKGAMKLDEVDKLLKTVPNLVSSNMILHFRFATEGAINRGNCHPYPISHSINELRATRIRTKIAIAHNGIIPSEKPKHQVWKNGKCTFLPQDSLKQKLTDTQDFIRTYLAGMGGSIMNKSVAKLIEAYTYSKFALLAPNNIMLIGEFIEDQGIYYSNYGYKRADYYTKQPYSECDEIVSATKELDATVEGRCEVCTEWAALTEVNESSVCDECLKYFPEYVPSAEQHYGDNGGFVEAP